MRISKKKLQRYTVGLVVAFTALTAGLTIGSRYLNQKHEEEMQAQYTAVKVEKSDKVIVSATDPSYEEMLANGDVSYDKIGDNIYIIKDVSENEMEIINSMETASVQTDIPFVASADEATIADMNSEETEEIADRQENLPEGYTWKQLAQERGQKLVALIDTGVNNYAIHSEDFTGTGLEDKSGHGTTMARAIDENADGKAMILSLKAINYNGIGYMSSVMQAVQYAREQGADIINMSIVTDAGEGKEAFVQLIKDVMAEGITVVASAGNYQSDVKYYLPAGIDGVISVGAVDEEGNKLAASNYGDVTYYAKAGSTSAASAIVSGYICSGDSSKLSSLLTPDEVVLDDEMIREEGDYEKVYDSESNEVFVVQASNTLAFQFPSPVGTKNYTVANSHTSFTNTSVTCTGTTWGSYTPPVKPGESRTVWNIGGHTMASDTSYPIGGKTFTSTNHFTGYYGDNTFYIPVSYVSGTPLPPPAKKYTLTVNPNGGTLNGSNFGPNNGTSNNASVTVTEKKGDYSILGTATRTNYTFLGFYTAAEGGTQVFGANGKAIPGTSYWNSSSQWIYDGNLTVYAHWKALTSSVSIDAKVGTFNGVQTTTVTQQINSTLTVNAKAPTYTVTFDSDGGTSCESMDSSPTLSSWTLGGGGSFNQTTKVFTFGTSDSTLTANWSNNSIMLPTPSKTGYTFKGWTSNGSNRLTGSYTVTGSVKLTAVWKINTYTVTFMDGHSNTTLKTQPVEYNKDATPPANPSRTGYKFAGWSGSYTKVTENRTITATWTANKYTVVFNNNSPRHVSHGTSTDASAETTQRPSGSMSNQSFTYDTGQRLTGLGYSWAGHTFLGWSTNKNASSATYANTAEVKNLTAADGGTVTLYAIWRADAYSLTVNANAPNGSWNSQDTSTPNNSAGQSPVWGDTVSLGKATPADRTVTITYDKNGDGATVSKARDTSKWIFDKWILNDGHKGIIFNNGESNCHYVVQNSNDTVTATYYYATIELADASRPGYTFMGWYYDAECTRKAMGRDGSNGNARSIFRPTESVTLYARWEKTTFNFDETVSAYMQDGTTGDRGVYVRKVDERDLTPITTTASGSSAVIGIYRGSVASGNLVLKLDTKTGILNSAGAVLISSANADSNGFYNITSYLTAGNTYIMREIEIPDGYEGADDIPFYYDGSKRIQISMKDKPLGEDPTPWSYSLKATKVNPDGDLVAGAKFTLKNETTGQAIANFTTGTDGVICEDFARFLKGGHRYSLSETSAPEGYQIAAPIYFNAPTSEADYAALPDFTVVDQYKRFNLVVRKENSDKQPLQGATFQIFMKDADGDLEPVYMNENTRSYVKDKNEPNAVKAILTTGADGTITLKNLPLRANYTGSEADFTKSYYIKEVASPAGYNPLPEIMEILVPDNGNTTFTYTATDESIILTLETGGFGTKLFMFSGCATVSLAIVASLLRRRRRKAV